MDDRMTEQLDKILALADSEHDGEAVAALRKARQLLAKEGITFAALAKAAYKNRKAADKQAFTLLSSTAGRDFETDIVFLRQQIDDLRAQMQSQDFQLAFWRRRASELEAYLGEARYEVARLKKSAPPNGQEDELMLSANISAEDVFTALRRVARQAKK